MTSMLWDMHIHLDFMRNAREIAEEAEKSGLGFFGVTVAPRDYEQVFPKLNGIPNVRLGVGLHPWWAADGRCNTDDARLAAELIRGTRYVGEIGLDASPKHVPEGSLEMQTGIFETICSACAETSDAACPKILSLHSVKAAGLTLDVLERTGCLAACRCIFHWFTGSSEELNRAVRSGCMFSVNEMMLHTRRGREYARQLPADRLLLETDLPPGRDIIFSSGGIMDSLERTLEELSAVRGKDMRAAVIENSARLQVL